MNNPLKAGGIAALYNAVAYICGMVFFLGLVNYPAITDAHQMITSLQDHESAWYYITLMNYVFFGISLIILASSLKDRLKSFSPCVISIASVIAFVWAGLLIGSGMVFTVGMNTVLKLNASDPAGAALIWQAIDVVHLGLSGNGEIVGGLWTILISLTAFRSKVFPRGLNILGMIVGAIGIISIIPVLNDIVGLFGIGQIVWFIWMGIYLISTKVDTTDI